MSQRRTRELETHDPREPGSNPPPKPEAGQEQQNEKEGKETTKKKPPLELTFVTSNAGKLSEVQTMLEKRETTEHTRDIVLDCRGLDLPELQGDPREIACEKAKTAFKILKKPCLVEDTSLCFLALGDGALPGPYIRDFLKHLGHEGLNKILSGYEDKRAFAQCLFAIAFNEDEVEVFPGRCYGHIVPARGVTGFGWDPVFEPNETGMEHQKKGEQTFAEMSKESKNEISHRGRALRKLVEFLATL